jgi:hypothetical protein
MLLQKAIWRAAAENDRASTTRTSDALSAIAA